MVDVVDKVTRSRMMSAIKSKDTVPELIIRKALHKEGFRYKLHDKKLPGKPDLVFPKYKALIQIQGCFWHGHDCHIFKWPTSRIEFWRNKIETNVRRDQRTHQECHELGWRSLVIWECAIKGKTSLSQEKLIRLVQYWLVNGKDDMEISGKK